MRHAITLLALLALLANAPTAANAGLIEDARSLFTAAQDDDNPYLPVGLKFLEQAQQEEAAGNLIEALEFYRLAATIDRTNRSAIASARKIKTELDTTSANHTQKAVALLESNPEAARIELLKALRFNADNMQARELIREKLSRNVTTSYKIKEGDTLLRIAETQYNNPGGELLLTRMNKLSIVDTLSPGQTLAIPIVSAKLSKRLYAAPQVTNKKANSGKTVVAAAEPQVFEETLEESMMEAAPSDAAALLSTAEMQFGNGLYDTAVSIAEEVLAADSGNIKARTIRNDSYLELAKAKWDDGSAANTMRMLSRLPKGYKDSNALWAKAKTRLAEDSEPLYLAGVKAFLAEDLELAVEKWELTLEINPFHAKARSDLEKARKLLEAVKGL